MCNKTVDQDDNQIQFNIARRPYTREMKNVVSFLALHFPDQANFKQITDCGSYWHFDLSCLELRNRKRPPLSQ
jgi:hypothetical protein